jgi:cytochrome c-type biogenesis protein CcmH
VAGVVFLLVAGIGAATSYRLTPPEASSPSRSEAHDGTLARLKDYTRSIGANEHAPAASADEPLPDVNTMIDRLVARLQTTPDDARGWRMLGWSYYRTGRLKEAGLAYEKALALEPDSAEIKDAHDEVHKQVKAKASEGDGTVATQPAHAAAVGKQGDGPSAEQVAAYQAMPQSDRDAAIRAMVDGLASRLESSPRDAEGWARLMRSRVVLGEREVATTAFRKALEIFKDDGAASDRIKAAALELGLKTE